jgi:crotonobetainyl-CoA:carnitine CoA-transferase CaiB-like acyl-CoA transferase
MASVLEGIRVIDFGQYIAGPLLGMLLADQGADVIRVDRPDGPALDTSANATWNRGKRSIALDLKNSNDLATAKKLIASADVVIENFRPGVMDRLGLGYDSVKTAELIYCSLPGFANDDPRATVPGYEGVIGAATATYRAHEDDADKNTPVFTAIPIPSVYAAFQSSVSIAMSLIARNRDGKGQRIEVPLFDAMFPSIGARAHKVHDPKFSGPSSRGIWGLQYECKDGRWLQFSGFGNQNFKKFSEAAGILDWEDTGLLDIEKITHDPKLRAEHIVRAKGLFKTRTAQEWEDLIAEAGSEGAVCRTSAEWFDHPHARGSDMVFEIDDPTYGKMLQPGINGRLSKTPGEIRGPAPNTDQHRAEILAELGSQNPATRPSGLESDLKSALQGVKVLDLCIILAGPTCGRTMADFGADVIKIDSPTRPAVAFHNDVNRAKKSIVLDLKSEEGREIFWDLVDDADVICQNYRAGKIASLGLGYDEVVKRKTDIIYASMNAYGHKGPWALRPGHEQFAQACTGMQLRYGGDKPLLQPNPVNDYGTGFMGAYAVALALFHKQRTGEGQHVDSALAYTAMTLQSPYMQMFDGKVWDEPTGRHSYGFGPLHRAYEAKDGWLFIGARNASVFTNVKGLEKLATLQSTALENALGEQFLADSVDNWVRRLTAGGVGVHRCLFDIDALMQDPYVIANNLSATRSHATLGDVTTAGVAPRLSRTPVQLGAPAPLPGSNAAEILNGIGREGDFDHLVKSGVIKVEGIRAGW